MAWYKIDDQLHSHPKARRAGLEAMGLWTLAGSHCMSYLTDGFVEAWFVDSWPHGRELAESLVLVGLWLESDGGWQFHDWGIYQPTRESVLGEREAAAERKRRQRSRGQDGRYESRESHGVTPYVTDGVSPGDGSSTPSPTPTQVIPKGIPSGEKRETLLPKDWAPTAEHLERARENNIDVVDEAENFRLHAETHGRKAKSWNAAFTTWLKKAKPMSSPSSSSDWMNRSNQPTPKWMQG